LKNENTRKDIILNIHDDDDDDDDGDDDIGTNKNVLIKFTIIMK
jgi:hypothetical protein